jgi:hypothetical protein
MPTEWRSWLGAGERVDGPTGGIGVGAVTPVFEGWSVVVIAIASSREHFTADVEVCTESSKSHTENPRRRIAWWARDEFANYYRGEIKSWSGEGDRYAGELW